MADFLMAVLYATLSLFIILDPLIGVPVFLDVTKGMKKTEKRKQALIAASVAGALMYIFLFFNFMIFSVLGIDIGSFQIAGGILLFILGLQQTLGFRFVNSNIHKDSAAGIVIGTPLLCGPGTITTVLIMAKDYGILVPSIAIAVVVLLTWIILRFSEHIHKILGKVLTNVIARIMGMFVTAIAIKIIIQGIMTFL